MSEQQNEKKKTHMHSVATVQREEVTYMYQFIKYLEQFHEVGTIFPII